MPFSVENFTAQIAKVGLASPNKFEVSISPPSSLQYGSDEMKGFSIMCESASIGGRTVQSMLDIQYGIRREIAYGAPQYTPLSLAFLCSEKMTEKLKLDAWSNLCVDATGGGSGENELAPFNVGYYDEYKGNIKVTKLDKSGEEVLTIEYLDAWPKTISQVDLNHSTKDSTLRVTAEFSYTYWKLVL